MAEYPTPQERASTGATWLDEQKAEWWKLVNLAAVDLDNGYDCIAGHVFAEEASMRGGCGYYVAADRLRSEERAFHHWPIVSLHGFCPVNTEEVDELLAAWVTEVTARRELAEVSA